jgi:hypothetical protein
MFVLNNSVEEFSSLTVLHNDMDVTVVNEGFMELDNVRVVKFTHDEEFFLKVENVLLNSFLEDTLDTHDVSAVLFRMGSTYCTEMSSANHFNEFVSLSDISR